jgi:PAS domain S-box-containing protein
MHAPMQRPAKRETWYLSRRPRRAWSGLLIALAAIAVAYFTRSHLPGPLETRLVYATYYPAVIVATLLGGLGAGALATLFAGLIVSLWIAPPADATGWIGLAVFITSAAIMVIVVETMLRARSRAREAQEELKLAADLKKSEQQFRTLVEQASDGIFVSDSEGFYIDVNSAGCRMLKYSRGELLGRHIRDVIDECEFDKLSSELTQLRAGQTTFGEWRFIRKDGSWFFGEVSAKQLPDGRIQAFLRDITDRKRNEENQRQLMAQLEASEAHAREQHALFKSIFDAAPEAIAVTDTERRLLLVNPAFTRVFGYESCELIGHSTSFLYVNAEDFGAQLSFLSRLQAENPILKPRVIRFRRKNGSEFPGEIVTARYASELPRGYVGIIRDISLERKKEEELRQAQRLEALAQLTRGICHDFNNLLAVILGNLQLLAMLVKDEQLKEYIREAEQATEMGARLSQRLMTFSRQRTLAPAVCDVNDRVAQVLELLRRTLGEDIKIITSVDNDLWRTMIDPSEIDNAIINLAINARDAMPNGGTIGIKTQNVEIDESQATEVLPVGKYVALSLTDSGSGMSPEVLRRAFEPFFTTKEPGRGTGLGLSSVYGTVKECGGHVTIESEVGCGTTVTLYLPKLERDGVEDPTARTQSVPIANGHGELILVVEDNAAVRRVTSERIKALGYRTLEADDGIEAAAVLDGGAAVALVFSDIIMPRMTGLELARKIKTATPRTKILLTSGLDASIASTEAEFAVLRKPYSQAQLAQALHSTLHSRA